MSATNSAAAGKTEPAKAPEGETKSDLPSLGALDEDDEFEEFEEQGMLRGYIKGTLLGTLLLTWETDWNDAETDLSHLTGSHPNAPGARVGLTMGASSASTGDHLWQDSWDDDTVEDDFSKALRCVYARMLPRGITDTDTHAQGRAGQAESIALHE